MWELKGVGPEVCSVGGEVGTWEYEGGGVKFY